MRKHHYSLIALALLFFTAFFSCSKLSDVFAFKIYEVVYNSNGADAGEVPIDPALYATGETVTIAANTSGLSKTLAQFAGWSTREDGSGTLYQPGDSVTIANEDLVLWAVFTPTGPTTINLLAIPGVTVPTTGATPVTSLDTAQYRGTISWSPTVSNMFVSNTVYTATITLTPKDGYILSGIAADSFTVAGTTSATNSADSGVVTAVFPVTTANLSPVSDLTSATIGTLKAVQGGTFNNGSANMTVSSFRIGQYEITGAQYAAVMGTDPSHFSAVANHPVEMVNWYHAIAFCNKLSIREGLTPAYSVKVGGIEVDWANITHAGVPTTNNSDWNSAIADWSANGYRLPTEAEWEFAARGGNNTHNYTYAGSNIMGDVAWYSSNSNSTTHTIGEKISNELGLYDMSGNVREWCWDRFTTSYPSGTLVDYRGAVSGTDCTLRGGSWYANASNCRISQHIGFNKYTQGSPTYGFRVVRQ